MNFFLVIVVVFNKRMERLFSLSWYEWETIHHQQKKSMVRIGARARIRILRAYCPNDIKSVLLLFAPFTRVPPIHRHRPCRTAFGIKCVVAMLA